MWTLQGKGICALKRNGTDEAAIVQFNLNSPGEFVTPHHIEEIAPTSSQATVARPVGVPVGSAQIRPGQGTAGQVRSGLFY